MRVTSIGVKIASPPKDVHMAALSIWVGNGVDTLTFPGRTGDAESESLAQEDDDV